LQDRLGQQSLSKVSYDGTTYLVVLTMRSLQQRNCCFRILHHATDRFVSL